MNPIPPSAPIGPTGAIFPSGGYLHLIMLLAVVALFVTYGALFWAFFRRTRLRKRLHCPVRLRAADVLFRLAPDGARIDVLRCSVFGRRPITCGKVCLRPAAQG